MVLGKVPRKLSAKPVCGSPHMLSAVRLVELSRSGQILLVVARYIPSVGSPHVTVFRHS